MIFCILFYYIYKTDIIFIEKRKHKFLSSIEL